LAGNATKRLSRRSDEIIFFLMSTAVYHVHPF
jgi:hypothetical protein